MQGLDRLLAPLWRAVRGVVTRVRLTGTNDSGGLQTVSLTGLFGERLPRVVRLQQFGSSGHAPLDSTGLMLSPGGARSASLLVALDHPASRPRDLLAGEYRIYNAFGDFVHLRANGEIHVKASSRVYIEAPQTECSGDLTVRGDLQVDGSANVTGALSSQTSVSDPAGSMAEMRGVFNSHTQPVSGGVAQAPNEHMA